MSKNSTLATTAATISERELFAHFLELPIRHETVFGCTIRESDQYSGDAGSTPEDHLTNVDGDIYDAAIVIFDDLKEVENPGYALEELAMSLAGYLHDVETVTKDFVRYKKAHNVVPKALRYDIDKVDELEKALEEQDRNPRFRVPVGYSCEVTE